MIIDIKSCFAIQMMNPQDGNPENPPRIPVFVKWVPLLQRCPSTHQRRREAHHPPKATVEAGASRSFPTSPPPPPFYLLLLFFPPPFPTRHTHRRRSKYSNPTAPCPQIPWGTSPRRQKSPNPLESPAVFSSPNSAIGARGGGGGGHGRIVAWRRFASTPCPTSPQVRAGSASGFPPPAELIRMLPRRAGLLGIQGFFPTVSSFRAELMPLPCVDTCLGFCGCVFGCDSRASCDALEQQLILRSRTDRFCFCFWI
jgi:hypothetical protein